MSTGFRKFQPESTRNRWLSVTSLSTPLGPVHVRPVHVIWMLELASHGLAIPQIHLSRGVSNTEMLSATSFMTS